MIRGLFTLLSFLIVIPLSSILIESDIADYNGEQIILSGNVNIEHDIGCITADKVELIRDEKVQDNFKQIKLCGHVHISLKDGNILNCFEATIDNEQKMIFICGEAANQISFHSRLGTIQGNSAQIVYTRHESTLLVQKIDVMGDVKLQSNTSSSFTGYAQADTLCYFPQKHELFLSASPGKRVHFFDPAKNSKMSASAIHIQKHLQTGKEIIQGKGNVKIIFDTDEIKQMKTHYSGKNS
jgi:lipopolysaccharide export system protein LptA